MRDKFPGYYSLDEEEYKDLWENCVFVFDTNVLLNLYRYPKDVSKEFINVLRQIQDRIWIPYNVGLEFQDNRRSVIHEQGEKFDEVKEELDTSYRSLQEKFNRLKKRHSIIDPSTFLDKVKEVYDEFRDTLEKLYEELPNLIEIDSIRDELDILFEQKIGEPFSNEELKSLYKEGEERYSYKIPPGYKDKKDEKFSYSGRIYDKQYGDLILWKQILKAVMEKQEITSVILVTDDDKEDWWWRENGQVIGPRPELVEEILKTGGLDHFYMYNSERFLNFAKVYMEIDINEDSINKIKTITQAVRTERFSPYLRKIIEFLWNDGDPIGATPSDILQNIGAGAYGNHSKLSLPPWGLVETDTKSSQRVLTPRGEKFIKGESEIPLIIMRDPETLEWLPDPESEMIRISDVCD
jgi:hypothetical protein